MDLVFESKERTRAQQLLPTGVGILRMRAAEPSKATNAEDEWMGVKDPTERKKRQNRMHQKAWRVSTQWPFDPSLMLLIGANGA
jgi:hypothetical protein